MVDSKDIPDEVIDALLANYTYARGKEGKAFAADLKEITASLKVELAQSALEEVEGKWSALYPHKKPSCHIFMA